MDTKKQYQFIICNNVLLIIILIALLIRTISIFSGIPYPDALESYYHPDEPIIVKGAATFPDHSFIYRFLHWPTFFTYMLAIITMPIKFLYPILNYNFNDYYLGLYIIARFISITAGVLVIPLVYYLSNSIFDRKRAVLSSIFLTFSMIHVNNSSYATPDVMTSFFVVLFTIFVFKIFKSPKVTRNFIYAGITLGLLTGTKYTGAMAGIFMVIFVVCHTSCQRKIDSFLLKYLVIDCAIFIIVYIIVFFLTTPGVFIKFDSFLVAMNLNVFYDQARWYSSRTDIYTWIKAFYTTVYAIGLPLTISFLIGIIYPLRKKFLDLSIIIFLILYYFITGPVLIPRYLILIIPFICIIASNGVIGIYESRNNLVKIIGLSIMVITIIYSITYSATCIYLRFNDTRTQAAKYIDNQISKGNSIGIMYESPLKGIAEHPWRYPKINFNKYKYADFLEYPKYIITSSYDLDSIVFAVNSDMLRNDYSWDQKYNKYWYNYSPPTAVMFKFYVDFLDPKVTKYNLVKSFNKNLDTEIWPYYAEFASPEIRIYGRNY